MQTGGGRLTTDGEGRIHLTGVGGTGTTEMKGCHQTLFSGTQVQLVVEVGEGQMTVGSLVLVVVGCCPRGVEVVGRAGHLELVGVGRWVSMKMELLLHTWIADCYFGLGRHHQAFATQPEINVKQCL